MSARICTQCGAPLHGNTCEYCSVEYEPEYRSPFTKYEVREVTPQELRAIRCEYGFERTEELLGTQFCGIFEGKLLKMVPSRKIDMKYIYDAYGHGMIAVHELDIIRPTREEAALETNTTEKEV